MSRIRVCTLLLALALVALPAMAQVYHVTLKNGTEIQTARQPQQASWDPNMVLFLTEVGNWVGFSQDEIAGIRADNPIEGYGVQISSHAMALGWSPNDLPEPGAEATDANSRLAAIAERQLALQEKQQNYSINQFVQPDQTQGIPASFGGYGSSAAPFAGLPLNQAPVESQDRLPPP